MAESEGTIRFRYELRAPAATDVIPGSLLCSLESWRLILERLAMIGRDAARYDGFAFGNLSVRDPASSDRFFISASQMADAPMRDGAVLPRIDACDLRSFSVVATGTRPPSSESATHAMVYQADHHIDWIFHVHSPAIWHAADALGLATTDAGIPYGSPTLALAVGALLRDRSERPLLFATLGHEDGVFACGAEADTVGTAVVAALARAQVLEHARTLR